MPDPKKPTTAKGHRVIGIRHALRHLKEAGLVEEDVLFPADAVSDVQADILAVAERWYIVGAKRGALEVIQAILDGHFDVEEDSEGNRTIVASNNSISWRKHLNVRVGNKKLRVGPKTYKLTLADLDFDT